MRCNPYILGDQALIQAFETFLLIGLNQTILYIFVDGVRERLVLQTSGGQIEWIHSQSHSEAGEETGQKVIEIFIMEMLINVGFCQIISEKLDCASYCDSQDESLIALIKGNQSVGLVNLLDCGRKSERSVSA